MLVSRRHPEAQPKDPRISLAAARHFEPCDESKGHGFSRAITTHTATGLQPLGYEMQSFRSKRVIFLGEQDGAPEQDLKAALISCLAKSKEVKAAYLTRISLIETPGSKVALCIYPRIDSPDAMLQCIGATFGKLFSTVEHLDILFLEDQQLIEANKVAQPFFQPLTN